MKNTDEIAEYVFRKRSEILEKRRHTIKKVIIPISSAACVSIALLAAVHVNNKIDDQRFTADNDINITEQTSASEKYDIETVDHREPVTERTDSHSYSVSDTYKTALPVTGSVSLTVTEETMIADPFSEIQTKPEEITEPAYIQSVDSEIPVTEAPEISSEVSFSTSPEWTFLPSWSEREISEKFTELSYGETVYLTKCAKISSEKINDKLGDTVISGQDFQTLEMYQADVSVYSIKSISVKCAVAVRFENGTDYYVYTTGYYFPETLNDLLADISYEDNVRFGDLYYSSDKEKAESYDRDLLMKIIKENRYSECISDDTVHKVRFKILTGIDELGIVNKTTTLTEDGWLLMNIMEWGYSFYIGTDAVEKFAETVK